MGRRIPSDSGAVELEGVLKAVIQIGDINIRGQALAFQVGRGPTEASGVAWPSPASQSS